MNALALCAGIITEMSGSSVTGDAESQPLNSLSDTLEGRGTNLKDSDPHC